jgi:hypothetical protein
MSDLAMRARIYDALLRSGHAPAAADLGDRDALQRLADGHVLVLDDAGEILMAPPFSAVPTPFLVQTSTLRAFGNCIWDALGIAAMLQSDVEIATSCGDCGTAMGVAVRDGVVAGDGLMHFALPARQWWQDIVFT